MDRKKKIILAVTGASGSLYARLLAQQLLPMPEVELTVIATDNGLLVMRFEDTDQWLGDDRLKICENHNLFAPPASGSARYDAMVVVPCSMGTLGRIACGTSQDLVGRAADVMLKERRRLILVPRETPLNTLHLRNMTTLSECGAVILPANPSFYSHPSTREEICRTVVDRIVSLLGLENDGFRWGEE